MRLPASYPRVVAPTVSAALTDWESIEPAVGSSDRPQAVRSCLLTAAEGDDDGVIDDADGSAGFVGIVAASTSTCPSPYRG
jgi:hypothetical protein